MADTLTEPSAATELPDGPHDLEFFLDPLCPFAWQTSVWLRRVAELRGLNVGWRFISLYVIHENDTDSSYMRKTALETGLRFHRVLNAVRDQYGNEPVGRLYKAWGEHLWYGDAKLGSTEFAAGIDIGKLLEAEGLPVSLADEATNETHDAVIRAETALGFERAGDDLGTPIITYDPPHGNSFFGPVISSVPDDEESLAIYDAVRTLVKFQDFAEVKRTKRPSLDLPILKR